MNITNGKGWTLLHDKLVCPEGIEYSFNDIELLPILIAWKKEQEHKHQKSQENLIHLELL